MYGVGPIPAEGEAIVAALAERDRLEARIAQAVAAFDRARLWDLDAASSMTAWLRRRGRCTRRDAARIAARAKAVGSLPVTAAAWSSGRLSSGQVDAIVARLRPETRDRFAEHEEDLVPVLAPLSVTDTTVAMSVWAARAEAETDPAEPAEPERSLHASRTLGGHMALDGELDPATADVVEAALRVATRPDDADEVRAPSTRRADALGDICRFFLDHQQRHRGGRHRPHVNLIVEWEAWASGTGGHTADGHPVGADEVATILCDCALHRLVRAGRSSILDYGAATRTIPANLWNALVIRDQHCRWPDCDRPAHWCDGHHVRPFPAGPTSVDNLVLLCRHHHRRLHHGGWEAKLLPDGDLEITDPGGRVRTSRPPGVVAAEAVAQGLDSTVDGQHRSEPGQPSADPAGRCLADSVRGRGGRVVLAEVDGGAVRRPRDA